MQEKGRRTMARHFIRALGGIALAGGCLALAACSSGPAATAAGTVVGVPVKNGTVTVKEGSRVICVMTVVNGKGTCKVSSSTLPMGPNAMVGEYSGAGYKPARSNTVYVEVVKVPTAVALSVSPATVTYGNEQVAHLSVKVTAANGAVPAGNVLVGTGHTLLCTAKLSHGAGSCTLGARQLKVGTTALGAIYRGTSTLQNSTSKPEKITVAS
jgi:hypothetical protein